MLLCLLIISKCTLDYFYDGRKHNESRTDCNSCNGLTLLERKISISTSALETEIIFNLLSVNVEIKENHFHLHTHIRMLDCTFHAKGLSLEFWLIEVEIHMEHSNIRRRLPCELDIFCTFTTAESRAKIWYQ